MKKFKILTTLTLMCLSGFIMAQDEVTDNRENFQLGFKVGLNVSNVYNSQTDDFRADGKAGFAGGAFFNMPIDRYLGFQPGAIISQKGFKGEGTLLGSKYNFTRTSTFLDIPLLVAVKPSEFITIIAGPQFAYLLHQTDKFTNTLVSYSQEQEFANDNIRKNIFGFTGGIDINLRSMVLSSRVGWDLQRNNGDGSSSGTPKYKNAWVQGTIGYMFN